MAALTRLGQTRDPQEEKRQEVKSAVARLTGWTIRTFLSHAYAGLADIFIKTLRKGGSWPFCVSQEK